MRESPTRVAPPYMIGATNGSALGWRRRVSLVTEAATANAVVVCPDGNDCRSDVRKPPPNRKSRGLLSAVTYGRERPNVPLRKLVVLVATITDSRPCQPKSATFCFLAS